MNDADIRTLLDLNENYIRSVQQSDTRWFDAHLAPDFVNGNPDCTLSDRAAFLAAMGRPCSVSGLRAEDVRVQDLGDVAVVRARTVYTKPDGTQGAGRYSDVYARQDGRWLCVCERSAREKDTSSGLLRCRWATKRSSIYLSQLIAYSPTSICWVSRM